MDIRSKDKSYVASTYARFEVAFVKGEGSLLYDEHGEEYIDLGTGIAVSAFGVSDPIWANAVAEQARSLSHVSNLYYSQPQDDLAELLCTRTGMKKVFFGNSGAEANECAIKVARKYASDRYEGKRQTVITLKNSFHGRTVTTLAATGQDVFHTHFTPFTEGFAYAEPNNFEDFIRLQKQTNAIAVLMELVQGESGVHTLDKSYVQAVAAYCAENDMLLMIDEVQTGNGRTGTLYAYEQFGIQPDLVTTAKGLGGGLPIGACLMGERVADVLGIGSHGSTFGGNPICAAGAYNIISRINGEVLEGVKQREAYIRMRLMGEDGVLGVDGMGLMLGISCKRPNKEIVQACLKRGVVCLTAKNNVRLLPALNIPMRLLERAMDILVEEINSY